jgi:hypothetical protein
VPGARDAARNIQAVFKGLFRRGLYQSVRRARQGVSKPETPFDNETFLAIRIRTGPRLEACRGDDLIKFVIPAEAGIQAQIVQTMPASFMALLFYLKFSSW